LGGFTVGERMNRNRDGSRTEISVPEGILARVGGVVSGLAPRLLCIGLVRASLGQKIERSIGQVERALKPLARISVYISAEAKNA
jgi:hypothetical protein